MQGIHWREVCGVDDIQVEDMRELEIAGSLYLVYRTPSGFYASSGLCTHEGVRLADGLILGELIECPRHQGRFHIPTGQAKRVPARKSLATFPTKVEAGRVYIGLPSMEQRSPTQ
jgi:3-phenylpropionate/trans-cinnamate dioxygenase ferredoxin subunit